MEFQKSISFEGVDTETPPNHQLSAKYTKSFAYFTVKERLPVILTKIINDLVTHKSQILKNLSKEAEDDLKEIIGKISKLKNEVVTNKEIRYLLSSGEDVEDWNKYLDSMAEKNVVCWYYSPWLYVECYMYRRLEEVFETSQYFQNFDPFHVKKKEAFFVSLPNIKSVGKTVLEVLKANNLPKENKQQKFIEFLKLSLWSNTCDLSLSNGEQVFDSFNFDKIIKLNASILCDDSLKVFEYLEQNSGRVIDFVNDNASFEIFSDLCFCDFLCTSSLVSKIRYHVKKMPWYVSDTTKRDITWLLKKLKEEGMIELSDRWQKYIDNGTWLILDEKFWTLPFDYNDLKTKDPALYQLLSNSSLIIFKGDLNYRKLLGDINWNHCEKFKVVLRSFKPTSVLTLRSVKADLICGLEHGQSEMAASKNKMWMRTGEFAVIQFYCHS